MNTYFKTSWLPEKKNDILIKLILFLISPFVSFLYSLLRIKTKSSFVVFFLFSVVFGMSMNYDKFSELDGFRHKEDFLTYQNQTISSYTNSVKAFFTSDNNQNKDLYEITIKFLISRFTNNYHVLYMFLAVIFSIFSLKTFKIFTSEKEFDNSFFTYVLAYIFMSIQIFEINGVRFYTAAWIALFSLFKIFRDGKNKFILLAFLTPFIHSAYYIFIFVLLLIILLKKYDKFWNVMFIISFLISEMSLQLVRNNLDLLPDYFAFWAGYYVDDSYIVEINRTGTGFWFLGNLFSILVRAYINLMVVLFIKNSSIIKSNNATKNLYLLLLPWMCFVNFAQPIPSLGSRFMMLSYPIIAYIWLVNFKGVKYNFMLYSMPFVFLFSIYNKIGLYMLVLEPCFFYSSPFYLIYKYLLLPM